MLQFRVNMIQGGGGYIILNFINSSAQYKFQEPLKFFYGTLSRQARTFSIRKAWVNEIKDFDSQMCKIASQLLHEYRMLNLVVYEKILYRVKIKVDFFYTIKKFKSF